MECTDAELIAEFVVESQEGLANIEQQMLAIEAGGVNPDLELVNSVFRTMHTIKGTAGFLGLDRIGALAHGLEEVLNGIRNREIPTSSELVTTILQVADSMKGLIDAVETSNDADIEVQVTALQRIRPSGNATIKPEKGSVIETTVQVPITPAEPVSLNDAATKFISECREKLGWIDQQVASLKQQIPPDQLVREVFRAIHALTRGAGILQLREIEKLAHDAEQVLGKLRDLHQPVSHEMVVEILSATAKCREGLRAVETAGRTSQSRPEPAVKPSLASSVAKLSVDTQSTTPQTVVDIARTLSPGPVMTESDLAESIATAKLADAASSEKGVTDKNSSHATAESTIRVDVDLLDKLMTRIGELVLARNQIIQYTNRLEDATFVSIGQRLNLITTELQESVMKTRMQPIGNVWAKFPRVVRDLASQLDKQVRIEMEGKETELDRTIIEAIKDPLTHLVRNSVDHGIETQDVRRAAGKPAEGCLLLRAYHEGSQVNIEITDDGAGLNFDRIRKKAVERGLVSADQAVRLSDRDTAQLIFAPGFSTAERVTSISGRGVGMDVVKTNIERISGTIDLQSRPGQGTTVKIKIPLTLAIIQALVITNDGGRYAIPQVSLLDLVRLDSAEAKQGIEYVHGAPVYRLRGKLLPVVYLSERLGLKTADEMSRQVAADGVINIVVLRANDRSFGLVVDKVNDSEEIVVKPLGQQLKGLSEYAGATIMGDGTVALILDVMGLAVNAGLAGEIREQSLTASLKSDGSSEQKIESLLVVDLGDSRRFALPTSMISRLEKVAISAIEFAHGREVLQYRGAIMPLVRLSDVFGATQCNDTSNELQIIVYADQECRCGFVVNRILDVVESEFQLSQSRINGDKLLGTSVIQERVTDVLNLHRLARWQSDPKVA